MRQYLKRSACFAPLFNLRLAAGKSDAHLSGAMECTVHIGEEFRSVPERIRQRLQGQLTQICAAINALDRGPLIESLLQSSLAITIGLWRFRYEFHAGRNRITVLEATRTA